jgi:hypothetical protein
VDISSCLSYTIRSGITGNRILEGSKLCRAASSSWMHASGQDLQEDKARGRGREQACGHFTEENSRSDGGEEKFFSENVGQAISTF